MKRGLGSCEEGGGGSLIEVCGGSLIGGGGSYYEEGHFERGVILRGGVILKVWSFLIVPSIFPISPKDA